MRPCPVCIGECDAEAETSAGDLPFLWPGHAERQSMKPGDDAPDETVLRPDHGHIVEGAATSGATWPGGLAPRRHARDAGLGWCR